MARSLGFRLYRIHAWTGLISGLFLIIICVSGSVLVFKPEIERWFDWNGYPTLSEPAAGESIISPDAALKAFRQEVPGARPQRLWLPALPASGDSNGPFYYVTAPAGKTDRPTDFLIDPYTGKVVASTTLRDGWGYWLRQLHLRLLYGQFWGRWIVGLFGVALTVATLTGMFIYLRFNANAWTPKFRRGRGSRVLWADIHKFVGIASLFFNFLFGVTGAYLGLETFYDRYLAEKTPATTRPKPATAPADDRSRNAERLKEPAAYAIARTKELLPHAMPAGVTFNTGNRPTMHVAVSYPAMSLIQENSGGITFDARTGEVIRTRDQSQESLAVRTHYAMEPLHFGRIGGWMWLKLLWAFMGLTGGILSLTGFAIYVLRGVKKRQTRKRLHATNPSITQPA